MNGEIRHRVGARAVGTRTPWWRTTTQYITGYKFWITGLGNGGSGSRSYRIGDRKTMIMEAEKPAVRILMLPWLAHGHISPFLELGKRLSRRSFFVYFCSSPANLASIHHLVDAEEFPSVQLVELLLPDYPHLPPPRHTTMSLPSHLMPSLKHAFDLSLPAFSSLLESLKPHVLIYDFLQPWAPAAASSFGIPSLLFLTPGAAAICAICHLFNDAETEFPFPAIYVEDRNLREASRRFRVKANGLTDSERFNQCVERSCNFLLIKTCEEMESKYMEYLSRLWRKPVVPVGPLVQQMPVRPEERDRILEWVSEKPCGSTVFVSFGTEYFMSAEELAEVARGLELSAVNFVWVVRFPDGETTNLRRVLPEGFMERVRGRGMVVEGWAPQGRILEHPSVGGFVTHCGWSSVMEGIWFGVPLVALPLQLDQPFNARLLVELGVGVEVRRQILDRRFSGEDLAAGVTQVMDQTAGLPLRRTAHELGEKMRNRADQDVAALAVRLKALINPYPIRRSSS